MVYKYIYLIWARKKIYAKSRKIKSKDQNEFGNQLCNQKIRSSSLIAYSKTQYFTGKNPAYPNNDAEGNNPLNPRLENFGYNVEVRCDCHYVPSDRVNIILSRM